MSAVSRCACARCRCAIKTRSSSGVCGACTAGDHAPALVVERMADACQRCGAGLVSGNYGGGCEDCDALLCSECAQIHGARRCRGRFLEVASS